MRQPESASRATITADAGLLTGPPIQAKIGVQCSHRNGKHMKPASGFHCMTLGLMLLLGACGKPAERGIRLDPALFAEPAAAQCVVRSPRLQVGAGLDASGAQQVQALFTEGEEDLALQQEAEALFGLGGHVEFDALGRVEIHGRTS